MTLKSCPFCGEEVFLMYFDNCLAGNGKWHIECWPCGLSMKIAYIIPGHVGADKDKMEKLIVKNWNRRGLTKEEK